MRRFRGRTTRASVTTVMSAVTVAALMCGAMLRPSATAPFVTHSDENAVRYVPASARALVAGCGPIDQVVEPTSPVQEVANAGHLRYDSLVPNSGWYAQSAAPAGAASATLEQSVRHLFEGGIVLWYSGGASRETVNELEALSDAHPQWDARVWQWPSDRNWQLPGGQVAIAVWGASQTCSRITPDVAVEVLQLRSNAQPITPADP